jgi:hypothetical protein
MDNIIAALIGALVGGLIAFIGSVYLKFRERREYLFDKYLNRLKMANEEVFIRVNEFLHRKRENNDLHIIEINKIEELDNKSDDWYNEWGSFFGTTCYFFCWLFFCIDKVRREIPQFRLKGVRTIDLMNSIFDLQYAFLKDLGIFYGIQMSIGREMEGSGGDVISYKAFCRRLMNEDSRVWFKRLIYFVLDFKKGNRFEQFYEISEKSHKLGILLEKLGKDKGTLKSRIDRESYPIFKLTD